MATLLVIPHHVSRHLAVIDDELARGLAWRDQVDVTFQRGAPGDLSRFEAAALDHLIMGEILEHFADPGAILQGVRRVLRAGG